MQMTSPQEDRNVCGELEIKPAKHPHINLPCVPVADRVY